MIMWDTHTHTQTHTYIYIITMTVVAASACTPGEFSSRRTSPSCPDCAARCRGVKPH